MRIVVFRVPVGTYCAGDFAISWCGEVNLLELGVRASTREESLVLVQGSNCMPAGRTVTVGTMVPSCLRRLRGKEQIMQQLKGDPVVFAGCSTATG